jgi:hypothetical protein
MLREMDERPGRCGTIVARHEDKDGLGRFIAPEGLQDSAQGFNPGNLKINEFALKGREADKINLALIAA